MSLLSSAPRDGIPVRVKGSGRFPQGRPAAAARASEKHEPLATVNVLVMYDVHVALVDTLIAFKRLRYP